MAVTKKGVGGAVLQQHSSFAVVDGSKDHCSNSCLIVGPQNVGKTIFRKGNSEIMLTKV